MPEKKPFNDFCLVEASHLDKRAFDLLGPERFLQEIAKRQDFAKEQIMAETKPGDLILLEAPDSFSYEEWCKARGRTDHPENRADWKNFGRPILNFYHELAVFAERNGRKAMSLESGLTRQNSRLPMLSLKIDLLPQETQERLINISYNKRNALFASRIEHRKPKMVIVADMHAFFLSMTLNPRKVKWFQKPDSSFWLYHQEFVQKARRVLERKRARLEDARRRIRARLK